MLEKNEIERIKNTEFQKLDGAESAVNLIFQDLNDIKNKFCVIGFRLYEMQRLGYFRTLGYENITDCAEHIFGIKKSTTYSLMHIASCYCDGMVLKDKYKGYSQSQLIEMSTANAMLEGEITADMTVADIRDLKKALPNYATYYKNIYYDKPFEIIAQYRKDQEEKFQTSGKTESVSEESVEEVKPRKLDYLSAIFQDRTTFKHRLAEYLEKFYTETSYKITCYDKKQNLKVFLGSLSGIVHDSVLDMLKTDMGL